MVEKNSASPESQERKKYQMKLDPQTNLREYFREKKEAEDRFWRNLAIAACVLSAMLLYWLEQLEAVTNG
jgi:hypothetical protein